jgi:hypothetical protein
MISRYSGALALVGGLVWIIKVALIWMNGGTGTTGGVVGILFITGAMSLGISGGIRAWYLPSTLKIWPRALASAAFLAVLVLMVDLPILIGWQLFGNIWIAEELGIILTALIAVGLGTQWLLRGFPTTIRPTISQKWTS